MVKNHTTINFLYFGTGNAVEQLYMMYDIKFHTHKKKKTLWKQGNTSEEVILAGLCLAERLYFLVWAEIRFTVEARHEKHAHGFRALTVTHLFSGSVNQHANISEAKPLQLVGACSKW